ncbi:hypothetical protein BCR44DRAFT_60029 [Catenaria anguillulae PL171]|uniref:Uncharacterized protein n=1 Tax=Catenaria anguillulae PL171 TaxID=765915 RepID=A0A1Y2HX60_9FUNG|nr:hypothetical protein BCR44DRAFT_60029 [Catenaria anguillulae PL171]
MTTPNNKHAPVADTVMTNTTPNSILPHELWFVIFSLCKSTSHLPAAFRSDLFKPGALPYRIWTHRIVFIDRNLYPSAGRLSPTYRHGQLNSWYPSVAQIGSPVAHHLRGQSERLLEASQGKTAATTSSLVTKPLVDWLFSPSGSFGQQHQWYKDEQTWDWIAELQLVRDRLEFGALSEQDDEDDDDGNEWSDSIFPMHPAAGPFPAPASSTESCRPCPVPNWRLIPDAFLLVTFAIHTSQVDLLESTLHHMRSALPSTFATASKPFSFWTLVMLNSLDNQRACLSEIVYLGNDPAMTYPTFLCFVAILEWSFSSLQVLLRVFEDTLDLTAALALFTSNEHSLECILISLNHVTSPDTCTSVLAILDWFKKCHAKINSTRFPFVSFYIHSSYPLFAEVFMTYDLVYLTSIPKGDPTRGNLGTAVVDWVCKGHAGLLDVALDHGIVNQMGMGRVLRQAALTEDAEMAEKVLQMVDTEEIKYLVLNALDSHIHMEFESTFDPPSAYCFLLNLLVTHGGGGGGGGGSRAANDPNQLLIDHSQHWPRELLSILLFKCPETNTLLFSWDYPRHLIQHLAWAQSMHTIYHGWARLMGSLIDCCGADGYDWREPELDGGQVSTVSAIRLISLMHEYGPMEDAEEYKVSPEAAGVISALVGATRDKLPPRRFSTLVSPLFLTMLGSLVDAVTSFPRPRPLSTTEIGCPLAAHNVFVDAMLALDREFTVSHVRFEVATTVWVWPKFSVDEIKFGHGLTANRAIALVRAAVEAKQVTVVSMVLSTIAVDVRDSNEFARGLAGLARRWQHVCKQVFVSGMDQSEWPDGWAKVASHLPLPEDGEEEDGVGHLSSCEVFDLFG